MKRVSSIGAISLALILAFATHASASDLEEGELLFTEQCSICHGAIFEEETGFRGPSTVPRRVQLVMGNSVTSDALHLAVALPNGPPLRGIVGRLAASVEDFDYSKSILERFKGVVWSEEKLDRWITNSQAWVPGSFMFYKQPDAETRRKIILFLKANP